MYQLRDANQTDYDFVFDLNKIVYEDYIVKVWGGWDNEFQRQFFDKRFRSERIQIILNEDKAIGVLEIKENDCQLYIEEIQIIPGSQGKGIGTEIMNDILDKAFRLNKSVGLKVLKINRAKEFYERLGFRVTGETDTHFVMVAEAIK